MGRGTEIAVVIIAAVVITIDLILIAGHPTQAQQKGDCIMCTGAEPAAAGAAKGATEVAAASGLAGGAAGGTGLTLGTAGATGLTAGAAGAAGFSPALAAAGFTAGEAAGLGLASGVGSAISQTAGSASTAGKGLTMADLSAGASAANAGLGLLSAMKGQKTPPAPSLLAPVVMPTNDDEATRRARKAMLATLSKRRGRTSTILSNDTLGGN